MNGLPVPRRVLVVDDERDLADLAKALLSHYGFEVSVAYCAADALRILATEEDIDAVFSDVMMPGMTGLQLALQVWEYYPRIKVVLTSGFASPALMDGPGGTCPFVAKPYKIETVIKLLQS